MFTKPKGTAPSSKKKPPHELPPFKHEFAGHAGLRWDLQDDGERKAGWRFVVYSKIPVSPSLEGYDQTKHARLRAAAEKYAGRMDRELAGVELIWINTNAHRT